MGLIKFLLFLLVTRIEGREQKWKLDNFSVSERLIKTVLESCYGNNSMSTPILMFHDYNGFIDGWPIIRINDLYDADEANGGNELSNFKASIIVLIEDSPEKLKSDLTLLRKTRWWNHMASFFIIGNNKESCGNFTNILRTAWEMDILNSVYTCAGAIDAPELYTLNPMGDYAPYPWKRVEGLDDFNVFRQHFDPNISCKDLNYDKTNFLNGSEIKILGWTYPGGLAPGIDHFEKLAKSKDTDSKALRWVIEYLHGRGTLKFEMGKAAMDQSFYNGSSDVLYNSYALDDYPELPFLFPHLTNEVVAVIKLRPDMSTLQKIIHLWSTPVLILAGISLSVLALILRMMNDDLSSVMLDITRMLTYTSILTNTRGHSFRVYFVTMLIFMIISNGVFQGRIAAFLTKQEKVEPMKTIDELVELGYKIYTPLWVEELVTKYCPKCDIEPVSSTDDCIRHVSNSTLHACVMKKQNYEAKYNLLPLEYIKKPVAKILHNYKCRKNWPLQNRFNHMITSLIESGIHDFWLRSHINGSVEKRQFIESEWTAPHYRPVQLPKLEFAFHGLAIGIFSGIIAFFLEVLVADYRPPARRI